MSAERSVRRRFVFNEIFNALMCGAIAFAAFALMEIVFTPLHLRPWGGVLRMLPCLAAYPLGRIIRRVNPKIAIGVGIAASVLISAIPLALMFRADLAWSLMVIVTVIMTFTLFIIPFINGSNLMHPTQFIGGMLVFGADVLIMKFSGVDYLAGYINTVGVIVLCAGLFVMNRENLRIETSPDGRRTKFPSGMRFSNSIFILVFIAIAFILANLGTLKQFFVELVISISAGILIFIDWIGGLMGISAPTEGSSDGAGTVDLGLPGDYTTESEGVQLFWEIVMWVIIVALCIAAVFIIIHFAKNFSDRISSFFSKLFAIKPEEVAYVDETEDLADKQKFNLELKKRFKKIAGKLKRPPRFEDMPTNREKVRFTYKRILTRMMSRSYSSVTKTPIELAPSVSSSISTRREKIPVDEFMDIYNRARYSREEIADEEAEVARKLNRRV